MIDSPGVAARDLAKFIGPTDSTSNGASISLSDIRSDYQNFDFSNESGSPSKLASEIFEYISGFKSASQVDFSDSLLDDWDARLQTNLHNLSREVLILFDGQQRDDLVQQRHKLTSSTI